MTVMARLANWLSLAVMLGATALLAAQTSSAAAGTPEPEYAQAKGDECVRDDQFMIRNHPDLLKHQRNDTMRRGIRAGDFSLKRCMECHTNNAADSASIKTDCDNCHAYVAVKLDCWDCHAKKPVKPHVAPAQASQPSPMMTSVQTGGQLQ